MFELKTEHIFDARFTVTSPDGYAFVGNGGWGTRVIAPVTGGTVEGPKIRAKAKNFGADWFVIRHDGTFVVDVRLVLETDDDAFIHMYYPGIVDVTQEQLAQLSAGIFPRFVARVHTAPRFETGHEKYLWLNRIMGVGIGEVDTTLDPPEVRYSVFALT
ncbi:MAG: DUF3237 domain-containing protein [Pseudomonadota bacterium]